MALSERSRSTIYQALEPLLGEDAAGEMLSYFPAREVEEPATKEFVRAELARLETTIEQRLSSLEATLHAGQQQQLRWLVGTMLTITALLLAAARLLA